MKTKSPPPAKPAPAVWALKVECVYGAYLKQRPCIRVIEIPEDASLDDLHFGIQDAVRFDNDHPYDFYAGRRPFSRKVTYGESPASPMEIPEFAEIPLNQVFPLPERMKLYYWFDFGDDWTFQITKERKVKPIAPRAKYPRVVERIGPNPVQYPAIDW